jgi:hypothetical protein
MVVMKAAPIVAAYLSGWQRRGVGSDHSLADAGRIAT